MSRGAVAAGHPATAEAGVWALREGGNAVDAAVAAVAASFAAESPLTGLGAGGYMLVCDGDRSRVLDFFVEAPGRAGTRRGAELVPAPVDFTDTVSQIFNIGAASCGTPGTVPGLVAALERWGTMSLASLVAPAVRSARDGVEVSAMQAYLFKILSPILACEPEGQAIYAPGGRVLAEGDMFAWPDLADGLELLAAEGAEPFLTGDVAARASELVLERGGTLGADDFAAYEPVMREPVSASFAGREIVANPPPSSGGTLIVMALELLERLGCADLDEVVAVMAAAQEARADPFVTDLSRDGFAREFLDSARLDSEADRLSSRLGSTTHVTAVDTNGLCASVTCSNGTGSGLIVPGTGMHINNMLGEEDLNPFGFHRWKPGTRLPSMMSPTVIMRDGEIEAGLGSAGSNRIRSAILQVILRLAEGSGVTDAIEAPRIHLEQGVVHAEPGVDPGTLAGLERRGIVVNRWDERNMFFGGVQAVRRDPDTGELEGGGDPRRGGAVAYA